MVGREGVAVRRRGRSFAARVASLRVQEKAELVGVSSQVEDQSKEVVPVGGTTSRVRVQLQPKNHRYTQKTDRITLYLLKINLTLSLLHLI